MKEKNLWGWIKDGMFPGHWERVEARYPEGFPDSYCLYQGRCIFVELKMVETLSELSRAITKEQGLWNMMHRRKGGEAWVLAMVGGKVMWFQDAVAVRRGVYEEGEGPFRGWNGPENTA